MLELKFTDRFPNWMRDLTRIFNLWRESMAKYVACVQTIEEHFATETWDDTSWVPLASAARGTAASRSPESVAIRADANALPGWKVVHPGRRVSPRDVPGLLPPGLTAAT